MFSFFKRSSFLCLMSVLFLGACAEVELASHVAKQIPLPQSDQKSRGQYKVGSPYKIAGEWYKPEAQYEYTETGIASWYGPNFHGKKTANGEIFNMYDMTAAHRTLQLPSIAKVTNLVNGKSVIVRINDRGPFSKGRVLDLSKKAAQELDFIKDGTTRVKIEVLPNESRVVADMARGGQSTRGMEAKFARNRVVAPAPITKPVSIASKSPPVQTGGVYVQAGAFGNLSSAHQLADDLRLIAPTNIRNVNSLHKVMLGPFQNRDHAQTVITQLADSGQASAFVVTD